MVDFNKKPKEFVSLPSDNMAIGLHSIDNNNA